MSHSLHRDIAELMSPVKKLDFIMNAYTVYAGEIYHVYYTL